MLVIKQLVQGMFQDSTSMADMQLNNMRRGCIHKVHLIYFGLLVIVGFHVSLVCDRLDGGAMAQLPCVGCKSLINRVPNLLKFECLVAAECQSESDQGMRMSDKREQ